MGNQICSGSNARSSSRRTVSARHIRIKPKNKASTLLQALWRSSGKTGFVVTRDIGAGQFKHHPIELSGDWAQTVDSAAYSNADIYFSCAVFDTPENRKADNAAGAWVFWMDIDCGEAKAADGKGYASTEEANVALGDFCREVGLPPPTFIIDSGGGLHAYWVVNSFLDRSVWKDYAVKLKAIAREQGFLADPSRTADIASILRVPGTKNFKYDPPRPVQTQQQNAEFIDTSEMLDVIDKAFDKHCQKEDTPPPSKPRTSDPDKKVDHRQPDIERLKSALSTLDPDCDESTWKLQRIAPLARAAAAHPENADNLHDLARSWSSGELRAEPSKAWVTPGSSNSLTGEQIFDQVWQRFCTEVQTGIKTSLGTIFHDAKEAGWTDPGEEFQIVPTEESVKSEVSQESPDSALVYVQSRFALMNLNGKIWTLDRQSIEVGIDHGFAPQLALSNRSDGKLIISRSVKQKYPGDNASDVVKAFFDDPATTCYKGVSFDPRRKQDNRLNLWVAPTIWPESGSWKTIRDFLLCVLCNGDKAAFDYLLKYVAHALQFPEEKPGVMVIMLGGQGTGKGTFGRILQKIWRATFLQVHNIETVTGTFNAALERAYIVFLDEALFVGNRKSTDALKSVVTEPVILINEKHQPARQIDSYHRLIAATNAEHFKHTERDDRRDFVLRLPEERKGDHEYWQALHHEIENGGVEAMAHDLLAVDLSEFNVRDKPQTAALIDQKLQSLDGIEEWWLECLRNGDIGENFGWPGFVPTEDLVTSIKASGTRTFKHPTNRKVIEAFRRFCPSAEQDQRNTNLQVKRRGLVLPTLDVARAEFAEYIGGEVPW